MINKVTIGISGLLSGLLLAALFQCQQADRSRVPVTLAAQESNAARREVAPVSVVSTSEEATIKLFESAAPSVVYITTTAVQEDYWSRNVYEIPAGTGSGFIWDNEGHIVTNYHVVKNTYKAKVTLSNQETYDAEIIGSEPAKDLAVLKIKNKAPLTPIPLGSSHDLKVGQSVFAIGNPFGLDQTLTTGIISALGREIESVAKVPIRDVIQTDAAINPGNSGGPLLDISGRLIGVNTAIYSPSGAYAGIGFSVPVDVVNWVVPDLIKYGKLQRPVMGVELVQQQLVDRMGLEGALVMDVTQGSGADRAGIRPTKRDANGEIVLGDLIVEVNDDAIKSNNDLLLALEKYKTGDQVKVKVKRNNQSDLLTVTLGSSH